MTIEAQDNMDEANAVISWTNSNVFTSPRFDSKSIGTISQVASKELSLDVQIDALQTAIKFISREKNFNLERFPFD